MPLSNQVLATFKDNDPPQFVWWSGAGPYHPLREEAFPIFNLNIPSYIFVYCPIWYHLVALQRVWLCLLHNCSSSTAGQLRHPFSLLFIILNKPCSFHLPTAVQLSSSCQNAYCAGRVFCRKMNDYEIRKIQTVSLWISLHHFAVTMLPQEQNKKN